MRSSVSKTSALIIIGGLCAGIAQAALYTVDPGPYVPANANFPAWYQDTHGRALDLCLSRALSSRAGGAAGTYMCGLGPEPGVFDDTLPFAFPGNFPSEAFWFMANAAIEDAATGIELDFGAALEAAFSGDGPIDGDQVAFSRIRIRVDLTVPGVYTVTHPYGVDVFDITADDIIAGGGVRAINMTRDIGIAPGGLFSGALAGDVGPFLRGINGPYTETNPDTGEVNTYVGDPNIEEEVTGSPFATNYVRIEGPNGIDLRTNLFAITGMLSDVALPTPLKIDRATYSRQTGEDGVVARQDVFALAPPPPGTAQFSDTGGTSHVMSEENTTGNWYGQSSETPTVLGSISVTADNSLAIPSSSATTAQAQIVDQVIIHRAEYSLSTAQLTVEAESSDKTSPPVLSVTGNSGPIGDLSGTGAIKQLVTGVTPIPPASINVTSSNGGVDVEEVTILP
ncbi:hypothetical protein [Halopseudomonas laoshanensis]|uniref:hypothetical protein n=1 Tax=Halopseudomonas laoshanensis TaxID=2268758 RepID=UPI0037366C08